MTEIIKILHNEFKSSAIILDIGGGLRIRKDVGDKFHADRHKQYVIDNFDWKETSSMPFLKCGRCSNI